MQRTKSPPHCSSHARKKYSAASSGWLMNTANVNDISFYADKLCLTPHYLSTVIREVSGQTVMQWINKPLFFEAKVLLKHSDLLVF